MTAKATNTKPTATRTTIPKRDGIYTITPAKAQGWMQRNRVNNRPLRQHMIKAYAADMEAGTFRTTHQGIAFSKDGALLDGQHRLLAIIMSGVTVDLRVFVGCDPADFPVIDVGDPRSGADILTIEGYPYGSVLTAIIGWQFSYEDDTGAWQRRRPARVLEFMRSDEEALLDAATVVTSYSRDLARLFPGTTLGFVYYNAAKSYPRKAKQFLHGFATGEGLERGDPRLVLRNRMAKVAADPSVKLDGFVKAYYAINTWNSWVKGKKLSIMKYSPREDRRKVLPRFVK